MLAVSDGSDATNVDVRANATATLAMPDGNYGRQERTFPAQSTGKLEADFLQRVRSRLNGAAS
jgi:hypothetical protein